MKTDKRNPTSPGYMTKEFFALNGILFLAFCNMAVFFQFYTSLGTLDIDRRWFGLIIGIFSFTSLVVRPFIAPLFQPGNARPYMALGMTLMVAALLAYGYFHNLSGLLAVRVVHGLGHVFLVTALTALLMAYIPKEKSSSAFGFVMNINLLPYAVLPPLMGFLSAETGGFPGALKLIAFCMVAVFPLLLVAKPPIRIGNQEEASFERLNAQGLWRNVTQRPVAILLIIYFLIYIGYAPIFYFIKAFAKSQSLAHAGLFFTVVTVSMVGTRLLALPWSDKLGAHHLFAAALGLLAVSLPSLGMVRGQATFFLLATALGAGWGLTSPLCNALMFQNSPPALRGLNTNYLMEMQQAGFFAGPFVGGLIVEAWGLEVLFGICGLLAFMAFVLVFFMPKENASPAA
jgi:predicted MFS family arabinose efflux permease